MPLMEVLLDNGGMACIHVRYRKVFLTARLLCVCSLLKVMLQSHSMPIHVQPSFSAEDAVHVHIYMCIC